MFNRRSVLCRADVVALFAMLLALSILVVPALGKMREKNARAACADNLSWITKAMLVYSNENADVLPATWAGPNATYDASFSNKTVTDQLKAQDGIHEARKGDPMASLWILVLQNSIPPKTLICPSDPVCDITAPAKTRSKAGEFYMGVQSKSEISYSISYPWTTSGKAKPDANALVVPDAGPNAGQVGGWWKNNTDSSLAMLSDMAPLNEPKAKPVVDPAMKDAEKIAVTFDAPATQPTSQPATQVAASAPAANKGIPDIGHTYNSPNHMYTGQNIAYGDAHVEWAKSPLMTDKHNIWLATMKDGEKAISAGNLGDGVMLPNAVPYMPVMVPTRASDGTIK